MLAAIATWSGSLTALFFPPLSCLQVLGPPLHKFILSPVNIRNGRICTSKISYIFCERSDHAVPCPYLLTIRHHYGSEGHIHALKCQACTQKVRLHLKTWGISWCLPRCDRVGWLASWTPPRTVANSHLVYKTYDYIASGKGFASMFGAMHGSLTYPEEPLDIVFTQLLMHAFASLCWINWLFLDLTGVFV